jgi:amidase
MEIHEFSAYELAKLIRTRKVSPVEVINNLLSRVDKINPKLNAFITIDSENAINGALKAEKAIYNKNELGVLHGVPVGIKDLQKTRGMRTTFGSLAYKKYIPEEDSIVVRRLKAAGAIILGKTNTSEFGISATTENRLVKGCTNPWDAKMTAGGSSGGSAASVAAGLCPLAQGSDGGGSIRIPSSFCGVFGFKPSLGRVADKTDENSMPLFAQIGPITRDVRDGALMMEAISGPDPDDYLCVKSPPPHFLDAIKKTPKKMKVAWSKDLGGAPVDEEVQLVSESSVKGFEALGFDVEEATPDITSWLEVFNPIALSDLYRSFGFLLERWGGELMPYTKASLLAGEKVSGSEYSTALKGLLRFKASWNEFFEKYDLLMTPCTAVTAFPIGTRPERINDEPVSKVWGAFPFTAAVNVTGQPAASIPCGLTKGRLPVGLQIIGRSQEDISVLQAAYTLEQNSAFPKRLPLRC